MMIKLKRIYDEPAEDDGYRVLVDRLWPRGIRKEDAAIDAWMKEVAPSTELRKWFHRDLERWEEFRARYEKELQQQDDSLSTLREKERKGALTLLYAAKDARRNHAIVLRDVLAET